MNFKPAKPDPRILILQIILVGILSFYFQNQYAVYGLFFVVDILILFFYNAEINTPLVVILTVITILCALAGGAWGNTIVAKRMAKGEKNGKR